MTSREKLRRIRDEFDAGICRFTAHGTLVTRTPTNHELREIYRFCSPARKRKRRRRS